MNKFFQKLGKAMLLAVIVMPIAGILLRISSPDLLNLPILGAAGSAVFGNLDILFAIGVAMGFVSVKDRGKPAMLAVVAMLTLKEGLKVMNPDINMGIFGGIISGLVSAYCFDRFKDVKLPTALFFFFFWRKLSIFSCIDCTNTFISSFWVHMACFPKHN